MKFVFSAIAGDGRSSVGRRLCVYEDGQYSRDEQNRFFFKFCFGSFLSRVSILTRDIDIAICPSVCP